MVFEDGLSAEEREIKDILTETSKQLKEIDQQIKTLPLDRGYTPLFSPPGARQQMELTRSQRKTALEAKREYIKTSAIEKSSVIRDKCQPQDKEKVSILLEDFQKYEMSYEEKKAEKKDLDRSQDFASTLSGRFASSLQSPNLSRSDPSDTRDDVEPELD